MSKIPVSHKKLKGLGWKPGDNLHEIKRYVAGLIGGAILPGIFSTDTTVSEDKSYELIEVVENAELSAPGKTLIVLGDCRVRSARITAERIIVFGNLTVGRALGDTSYVSLLDVKQTIVHGNADLSNTQWIMGDLNDGYEQVIGGNLTLTGITGTINTVPNTERSSQTISDIASLQIGGNFTCNDAYMKTYGDDIASASFAYAGISIVIRAVGDINLPSMTDIQTYGGDCTLTSGHGGGGGDVLLSSGGDIVLGQTLNIDASGGTTAGTQSSNYSGDGGNVSIHYGGSLTGSIGTVDVSAGAVSGSAVAGADGTYVNTGTIASGYRPQTPAPETDDGAEAGTLTWTVPVDANGSLLDFAIEIHAPLNDRVSVSVELADTNASPDAFSGVPPYAEGTGTVTYTPTGLDAGAVYKWRVTAMKDSDVNLKSAVTKFREFTMA